jgi:hypothetical protein
MKFKRMPATSHRCRAGEGCSINIIPQAKFARSVDKEISDRCICCSSIAEEIDLAGKGDQVEIDTPVSISVGGWQGLLGVGIAIGGIALCCICAAMEESGLNGKSCTRSPGR